MNMIELNKEQLQIMIAAFDTAIKAWGLSEGSKRLFMLQDSIAQQIQTDIVESTDPEIVDDAA